MALYEAQRKVLAAQSSASQFSVLDIDQFPREFAWFVLSKRPDLVKLIDLRADLMLIDGSRLDLQVGAGSLSSGTTTLVVKTGVPDTLAGAFESGAFNRSVQGNSVTFSFNGENLARFLAGQQLCGQTASGCSFLHDLAGFATFDATSPGTQQAQVAALGSSSPLTEISYIPDPKTLTSAGVQWAITNSNDPGGNNLRNRLSAGRDPMAHVQSIMNSTSAAAIREALPFMQSDAFKEYVAKNRNDALALNLPSLTDAHREALEALESQFVTDEVRTNLANAVARLAKPRLSPRQAFTEANKGWDASVRYSYSKPYNQAALHNILGILKKTPATGNAIYTANFALDFFDGKQQTGVRDLQISGSIERSFTAGKNPPATLTLAGYYQYQKENAALTLGPGNDVQGITLPGQASILLTPRGHIWIVQAMVTLRKCSSGIVPIGFTYSNRTELLTGSEIRGHVGFQFNYRDFFSSQNTCGN